MKKLLSILFLLISVSHVYAADFNWPDAKDYNYPEYEVKLYKDNKSIIREAEMNYYNGNVDKFAEFLLNFKYDLKSNKNKLYTAAILNSLFKTFIKIKGISNDKSIIEFINQNENNNIFDDESVYKKFILWICLQKDTTGEKEIYLNADLIENFEQRRIQLLKKIILNSNDYAPLAAFILEVYEGESFRSDYTVELVDNRIKSLDDYIKKYPKSEFAAIMQLNKLKTYRYYIKDYEKAIEIGKSIINQYPNFYIGGRDLYHNLYRELIRVYRNTNDQEKMKLLIEKLNNNADDYIEALATYKSESLR